MSLDKKIYEKTCHDEDESDDSDVEKVCKAGKFCSFAKLLSHAYIALQLILWSDCNTHPPSAVYGFVIATKSECSMDGKYYLEYNGKKTNFNVHVKSCGNDDWDEYDSDYLYDSDAEDNE